MSSLGPSGSRALPSRSGRSGSSPRVGCRAGSADGCAAPGSGAASAPFCSWVEWPSSPSRSSSRRSGERSSADRARHRTPTGECRLPACRRRLPRRDRRAAPGSRSSMPRAGASRPSTRASADRSMGSGSATGCGCMTPIRRRSTGSIPQRARSISRSRPRSTSPTWLVDGSSIWVTDNERPLLHRIDIQSRRQTDEFPLAPDPAGTSELGWDRQGGRFALGRRVQPIDVDGRPSRSPDASRRRARSPTSPGRTWRRPTSASGLGASWGAVTPIDPATNKAGAPTYFTGPVVSLAAVGDDAWAANDEIGLLQQVQPGKDIAIPHFGYPGARSVSFARRQGLGGRPRNRHRDRRWLRNGAHLPDRALGVRRRGVGRHDRGPLDDRRR